MNKRIKKKKAKQEELKRQELIEYYREHPQEIHEIVVNTCKILSVVLENAFRELLDAFNNLADYQQKWREQFDEENSK